MLAGCFLLFLKLTLLRLMAELNIFRRWCWFRKLSKPDTVNHRSPQFFNEAAGFHSGFCEGVKRKKRPFRTSAFSGPSLRSYLLEGNLQWCSDATATPWCEHTAPEFMLIHFTLVCYQLKLHWCEPHLFASAECLYRCDYVDVVIPVPIPRAHGL